MKRCLILLSAAVLCMAGCKQSPSTMNRDFLQLASDRYSVRSFDSTATVSADKIEKILKAGQLAPTAVNSQPQKIYLVQSPEIMAKLKEISPCIYGAPHCFVLCYDDNRVCKRGENGNYGDIDVTIVLTHMVLEAENLGVGTCIVGYFNPERLSEELALPENIHPVLLLPFGYPTSECSPSDRHASRFDLSETVESL